MAQERIQKSRQASTKDQEQVEDLKTAAKDEEAEALKTHTDDLLDEIDGILEENAEEFVSGYIQKGGE